ncbi:hypothetical protein GOB33_18835 [Sinorhizobium meliloti]|nr:hypothetical protein [Sinorhizobium meliloti]
MKKGPRKGTWATRVSIPPELGRHVAPHPIKTANDQAKDFNFDDFAHVPLIWNNASSVRKEFYNERRSSKQARKFLKFLADFVNRYEITFATSVSTAKAVDPIFCAHFLFHCQSLKTAASKVRLFKRFLAAIEVPAEMIPPNPFSQPSSAIRGIIDERSARALMKVAKEEANIVRKRFELAAALAGSGCDPRRAHGGSHGAWKKLENRLWFCREILGLRALTHEQLIAEGHKSSVVSMQAYDGATVISTARGPEVVRGISAHLRFYHPSIGDLLPFISMLMIRSMVNFQSVADVQASSQWWKPYPFALDATPDEDRYVMITLPKARGAQESTVAQAPAAITFPSLKKPQSHPFQILQFVKHLTAPLRQEIERRINELRVKALSKVDAAELERLLFIRDDLFIYKTEWQITSLRWVSVTCNGPPSVLLEGLRRYGVNGGVRELRDAGLHFSFKASSHSLVILHMLARHGSKATARDYARRREFFRKSEDLFIAMSERSVELVRASRYSLDALRGALRAEGLEDWQITNVLDPDNKTRWGNGCLNPTHPPLGFNGGTPEGQACRRQDCIDGCPFARFLPDSLPNLLAEEQRVARQLGSIGIAKEFENSLSHRHRNLVRLIGTYPKRSVEQERLRLKATELEIIG